MDAAVLDISAAVKRMYEVWPYPDYSIFLPLRWQEAYTSNSLFARQLLSHHLGAPSALPDPKFRMLIAGCGDVLPSILGRWEPSSYQMNGIDLSSRSLRKARLRCWLAGRPQNLWPCNLEDFAQTLAGPYHHIDAFGVLHHLANPRVGLQRLSKVLTPGGTMRVMVYNSAARSWIFHLKRVFTLLGLSAYEHSDIGTARSLLRLLAQKSPRLRDRLQGMGSLLDQPARLVDAFFHEREARLPLSFWFDAFEACGLQTLGLLDRSAELDDLPNPLYRVPKIEELETRVADLRFENNLEIYLWKKLGITHNNKAKSYSYKASIQLRRRFPPRAWFRYEETKNLDFLLRWQLWQAFLSRLYRGTGPELDRLLSRVSETAIQRLGRIGAIFPEQLLSQELRRLLEKPLHSSMDLPQLPEAVMLTDDRELRLSLEQILLQKQRPLTTMNIIWQRLQRAQSEV